MSARGVDRRAQLLQNAVARDVILADSLLTNLDPRQEGDCAQTEEAQEQQKSPEAGKEENSRLAMRRTLAQRERRPSFHLYTSLSYPLYRWSSESHRLQGKDPGVKSCRYCIPSIRHNL